MRYYNFPMRVCYLLLFSANTVDDLHLCPSSTSVPRPNYANVEYATISHLLPAVTFCLSRQFWIHSRAVASDVASVGLASAEAPFWLLGVAPLPAAACSRPSSSLVTLVAPAVCSASRTLDPRPALIAPCTRSSARISCAVRNRSAFALSS